MQLHQQRQFRYSDTGMHSLTSNQRHGFALSNAMKIFALNAAYSMIPKNGCSTIRLSIALANGCICDATRVDWIHLNNKSFPMTTEGAFQVDYAFVILRCPYQRLYSAFLDKIVNMDLEAWNLYNQTARRFHPHEITFRNFVSLIKAIPTSRLDIHWRPQVDFLLYEEYDDVFSLEDFKRAETILEQRIGLKLVDSRTYLKHDIAAVEKKVGVENAADLPALELLIMKRTGSLPDVKSFYDDQIMPEVSLIYRDDIKLYCERLGETALMASAKS